MRSYRSPQFNRRRLKVWRRTDLLHDIHSPGIRFRDRHFRMWHDMDEGMNQPHESIKDIVNCQAHEFYWKRKPRHLIYYYRRCIETLDEFLEKLHED